jgi:hypothetical protein
VPGLKSLAIAFAVFCSVAPAEAVQAAPKSGGLLSDPSTFPIGVWLQPPRFAPKYQSIGINVFVGLDEGPTDAQLAELAKHGMPVIVRQNDAGLSSPNAGMIRGWMTAAEPDNAQPTASRGWGPCIPPDQVAAETRALKQKDPTRPVLVGFGRGVADRDWAGRGSCTGDVAYYEKASLGADILAFDIYPVASGYARPLERLAQGVDRLRAVARNGQQVWVFIETTRVESSGARVSPTELRAEVMLAIIRGADGIIYFPDEWSGGFREDGLFRYPEIVSAIAATNAQIQLLAPALSSPTLEGRIAASGTVPFSAMVKSHEGKLHLFAVSTDAKNGTLAFSIGGVVSGRAEAIGENREIPIVRGAFHDSFDAFGVHIYRIIDDAASNR